jgi:iron complex outermembrane receptor protein
MAMRKACHFAAALLLTSTGVGAQAVDPSTDAPPADEPAGNQTPVLDAAVPSIPVASPATDTQADAPEPETSSGSRVIEEIIVTAQKREERLADVPVSVQAFSGDKLEALGVNGPIDLPQITPGMQYNSLVGYSVVYLRGVGTDVFLPNSDPSVATYIDGIYFPFSHGLATDFGKLERVEVLKGPQGTLFGRNSTGGAINVVTAKPNSKQLEGTFAYEAGSFNQNNFKGYISGPLSDTLALGFSVINNEVDSYYERPSDSRHADFPKEITKGFNAKLNWEPTDEFGLTLAALVTRQTGLSSVVTSSFDLKPAGLATLVTPSPGKYKTDPDDDIHFRASSDTAYGEMRWSPGTSNIKLLGSYQDISTDTSFDFEGSPSDLVNFHPKDQGAKITTSELHTQRGQSGHRRHDPQSDRKSVV